MIMRKNAFCLSLCLLLIATTTVWAQKPLTLTCPNKSLAVSLDLRHGVPYWQLSEADRTRIEAGRLGVQVDQSELGKLETVAAERTTTRESVKTVWGKFAEYDNHYNQLRWTLRETSGSRRKLIVVVRAYDQGVALRYEFPIDGGWEDTIQLTDGVTEFRFTGRQGPQDTSGTADPTAWAYNRERDPVGPQPLSRFHEGKGADLPLTMRYPYTTFQRTPDTYMAVLEGAIFQQAPFRLVPIPDSPTAFRETFSESTLPAGGSTSWRVVLVAWRAGDLLLSPIPYCLNPPCELAETDWIKPGLAFWDWRAWGARTEDGFTYGLDMASWRRFIDFASKNNICYLVLDANWYGPEFEPDSDLRVSRDHLVIQPDMNKPRIVRKPAPDDWADPIDVPALIRYGKERNVGIILYINDIARSNYPFEETLALYQQWGAAGIKYGFMRARGQQKVLDTRKIVALCAKHKLLCNFHDGPVPPSGDRRAYPNYVTREFCHSQSDAMRVFSPTGFCEQVFVNMLAGPLDMCNGLYTLENPARDRPKIFKNVEATIVAETARVLITFSGFSILPDCPEAYEAKSDLFQFISRLPMTWDETRILDAEIGKYITTARRSGDRWFVASATNEEARELAVLLDFLDEGKEYMAIMYEDGPDAHFQKNRESYRIRELQVSRDNILLPAAMAPGGGHCIYLEPR